MEPLVLTPPPQLMQLFKGHYAPVPDSPIHISHPSLYPLAQDFRQLLHSHQTLLGPIAVDARSSQQAALNITLDPGIITRPDAFQLLIYPQRIELLAHSLAAVFYALQLLKDIFQQHPSLPCGNFQDWAQFSARGIVLKATPAYNCHQLKALIPSLAAARLNQLHISISTDFRRDFSQTSNPQMLLSSEDLLILDQVCRDHYVTLVPCIQTPTSPQDPVFSFNWGHITQLFDQLLPHFSGAYVHLRDLVNDPQVNFRANNDINNDLNQLHQLLKAYGKTAQIWTDTPLNTAHKEMEIANTWIQLSYAQNNQTDALLKVKASSPSYVCADLHTSDPQTRHRQLAQAASLGKEHEAIGFLLLEEENTGTTIMPELLRSVASYAWSRHP